MSVQATIFSQSGHGLKAPWLNNLLNCLSETCFCHAAGTVDGLCLQLDNGEAVWLYRWHCQVAEALYMCEMVKYSAKYVHTLSVSPNGLHVHVICEQYLKLQNVKGCILGRF